MTTETTRSPYVTGYALLRSFERHLKAENKRPDTLNHYLGASRQFLAFCERERLPAIEHVSREHVELWLERLHETYAPHSVRNRFQGLRQFLRWLVQEGEIERDPTARMKLPRVDETHKDVATSEELQRVFGMLERQARDRTWSRERRSHAERDAVIIAALYDTGMRVGELADLRSEHVNVETGLVFVETSKSRRSRLVRLSAVALRYLDRYQRHLRGPQPYLVQGKRGKLSRTGIYQIVTARFREAGVTRAIIGPHDLRHSSASHVALAGGMSESEMMKIYGWSDPAMVRHYTEQARQQAALEAHGRASPLTRLMGKR